MANIPKKVMVIGLDCALPHLLEKHIAEGHLPTFKKLIDAGVMADNCLVPYPTITPPNWASIATGAWPGTHGITDFHYHQLGTTPTNYNTFQSFSSAALQGRIYLGCGRQSRQEVHRIQLPRLMAIQNEERDHGRGQRTINR